MCTFQGQDSTSPCLSQLVAAQDTPRQQPNSFPSGSTVSISCHSSTPSFRCQQRLTQSKRVSLPASSRPWLVVTTAINYTPCDDFFQRPAVVPWHGSQQSHSGARVFSLALQLRDSFINKPSAAPDPCAQKSDSPDDQALTFCVTDHPSSQ